jgi:hypothetical protein
VVEDTALFLSDGGLGVCHTELLHWPGELVLKNEASRTWSDAMRWDSKVTVLNRWEHFHKFENLSKAAIIGLDFLFSLVVCVSVAGGFRLVFDIIVMSNKNVDNNIFIVIYNLSASLDCPNEISSPDNTSIDEDPVTPMRC